MEDTRKIEEEKKRKWLLKIRLLGKVWQNGNLKEKEEVEKFFESLSIEDLTTIVTETFIPATPTVGKLVMLALAKREKDEVDEALIEISGHTQFSWTNHIIWQF